MTHTNIPESVLAVKVVCVCGMAKSLYINCVKLKPKKNLCGEKKNAALCNCCTALDGGEFLSDNLMASAQLFTNRPQQRALLCVSSSTSSCALKAYFCKAFEAIMLAEPIYLLRPETGVLSCSNSSSTWTSDP